MTEQKREHPRYAIELDVEVEENGRHVNGRTKDISKGGFCMLTRLPLTVSAICEAKLALVFPEDKFSEQLELQLLVVWCTRVEDGQFRVGLKYENISRQNFRYLEVFLAYLRRGADPHETGESA